LTWRESNATRRRSAFTRRSITPGVLLSLSKSLQFQRAHRQAWALEVTLAWRSLRELVLPLRPPPFVPAAEELTHVSSRAFSPGGGSLHVNLVRRDDQRAEVEGRPNGGLKAPSEFRWDDAPGVGGSTTGYFVCNKDSRRWVALHVAVQATPIRPTLAQARPGISALGSPSRHQPELVGARVKPMLEHVGGPSADRGRLAGRLTRSMTDVVRTRGPWD